MTEQKLINLTTQYSATNSAHTKPLIDIFFDSLGYVGGGFMSLCLIPQIFKTCQTRSAKDISYTWQFCSITGLVMVFAYGVYFMLLPVFIPIIIEFLLMIILVASKVWFECQPRKK